MENIKFSIIVPVYNCEKYLRRCVDSIINQEQKEMEIILVDDGSIDSSPIICDEYSSKFNFIRVFHQQNSGVSAARNNGIKNSRGKYVCFLDADDYLSDNYIVEVNRILNDKPNVELINFGFYSDVDDLNLKTISSDKVNYNNKFYATHDEIKNDLVNLWDKSMLYNIWNKVYLKSILLKYKILFPDYFWGEDIIFNREYLDVINNFYNSDLCFYHYVRERNGAVTKKYKKEIFKIRKKEFEEFNLYFEKWKIAKEKYYEFSCRRFIERVLGCIENVYCSDLNFKQRYSEIKMILNDSITRQTVKEAIPQSKKIRIMLIPIKMKSTLLTMLMGKCINIFKMKFPSTFNKLKNRR